MKNLNIRHVFFGFPLIFLAVCGFYVLYLAAFRASPLPELVGLKAGEGTLELFEKTFGLAANLLVASVAIFLAFNALAISRRQHEIELETFLTQSALEAGREAVGRAQDALDAASAILRACSRLARAAWVADNDLYRALDLEHEIVDDRHEVIGREPSDESRAADHAARERLLKIAGEESADILTASRRLVGIISQHPDTALREAILDRHFGRLFDELAVLIDHAVKNHSGDHRSLTHDRLSRLLTVSDAGRRNILMLGHLVSTREWHHHVDDLLGRVTEERPEISDDFAMDIASGRYVDLDAAINFMSDWSPTFSLYYDQMDSFSVRLVPALVGAALDLANPFRIVADEGRRLDERKRKEPRGSSPLPFDKAREALERRVKAEIGLGSLVYPAHPATAAPQRAVLATHSIVGIKLDEDGNEIEDTKSTEIPLYA